jgi:hypothetical protein
VTEKAGLKSTHLVLGLILAALTVLMLGRMATRPLWYDEAGTLLVARIPGWSARYGQLLQAVDGQPPAYYWLCRLGLAIAPDPHFGLRLPSLAATLLAVVSLFAFLERRAQGWPALLGALIPSLTLAYMFSLEARPYALLLGLTCLAALAWQRHKDGASWGAPVFIAALFSLSLLHYYAFLSFAPFALAEIYLLRRNRRLDLAILAGFAVSLLPYIYHWPLMQAMKLEYSAHYWSPATKGSWFRAYQDLFLTNANLIFLAAAVILAAAAFVLRYKSPDKSLAPHEQILAAGFLLTPFTLWIVAKATGGGYVPRYVIVTVIGFALLAPHFLAMWSRWAPPLALMAAAVALLATEAVPRAANIARLPSLLANSTGPSDPIFLPYRAPNLSAKLTEQLPMAVACNILFLPMTLYATQSEQSRYHYLSDFEASIRYTKSDSADRHVVKLQNVAPLRIDRPDDFLAANPRFYLYSLDGSQEWLPADLRHRGYRLEKLGQTRVAILYLASK